MSRETLRAPRGGAGSPAVGNPVRAGSPWWAALLLGALTTTVANLVVLGLATAVGASLVLVDAGEEYPITVGGVVLSSTVPLLLGVGLAMLLALWRPVFLRAGQWVGAGLAVLSVAGPLSSDTDGGTVLALTLMHLVAGAGAVLALELHRRHRRR